MTGDCGDAPRLYRLCNVTACPLPPYPLPHWPCLVPTERALARLIATLTPEKLPALLEDRIEMISNSLSLQTYPPLKFSHSFSHPLTFSITLTIHPTQPQHTKYLNNQFIIYHLISPLPSIPPHLDFETFRG